MLQTSFSHASVGQCSAPNQLRRLFHLVAAVAVFAMSAQADTPPEGADKSFSVRSNSTTTLTPADWGFSDADAPPHTFSAVKIASLPATGNLKVDGVNVTDGQVVSLQPGVSGVTWTARESSRNWISITSSADGCKLAAVVDGGKIYTSTDSGVTWMARESSRYWISITSSADGSMLAAVDYFSGQIYTSTDSGVTWAVRESNRRWRCITSSTDGSKLAAVVDGGKIYTSWDSGLTWTARESNRYWSSITTSADGSKLAAAAYGDVSGGGQGSQIYTSTDYGVTWTARESKRYWRCITSSADGSKLAAAVYAGAIEGQIYTSTDSGVTWTARESNRQWRCITSSADGSQLAAVASGGPIYISTNYGVTWFAREGGRGWQSITCSADGSKLAAAAYYGQIYTSTAVPVITYTAPVGTGIESFTFQVQDSAISDNLDMTANTQSFQIENAPLVSMPTSVSITNSSAILGGDVTSDEGAAIIECGVVYSLTTTNADPKIGESGVTQVTATGTTGIFTVAVSGLRSDSGYSFKAYATNNVGITYTGTTTFTTQATPPEGTDKFFSVRSSGRTTLTSADWGFTDADVPPHTFSAVKITSLPATGTLRVGSVVAADGQVVSVQPVAAGVTWTARDRVRQWRSIACSAGGSTLAAVENYGKIYISTDSGKTWRSRSQTGDRIWVSITCSADGSKLAAVESYGNVYVSTDYGDTWNARATDALRYWNAITYSADGSVLAAVAGDDQIYISWDSGVSWRAKESARSWTSITSSVNGSKLAAVSYGGQIYTSTDFGLSWTARDRNRSWLSVTSSADGSKLAAVVYSGEIYTSVDFGVTWTSRESNRSWLSISSSADGSKLAAVVEDGPIYTSMDSGLTWTLRDSSRSWRCIASSADGSRLAAVVYSGQIYTSASVPVPVITYTHPDSTGIASFTFQVQDSTTVDNLDMTANTLTFKIEDGPNIATPTVTNITSNSAILVGNVISDGGSAIIERGVVYSLSNVNAYPQLGGSGVTRVTESGTIGVFTAATTGLMSNNSYSFSVYATNSVGTRYTNVASFTTHALLPQGTDKTFSVQSHSTTTLTVKDWGFTDMDTPAHELSTVRITSLPSNGTLMVDGATATIGQIVFVKPTTAGLNWTARATDARRIWRSITSSADGSKLAAVVGYKMGVGGQIYTSTDSGTTWTVRAHSFRDLPEDWTSITSSADGCKLVAAMSNGPIYTSSDSGASWTTTGLAYRISAMTSSADGNKLAAVDEKGLGGFGGYIYTSSDSGVTWTARGSLRDWISIASSADGSKLAALVRSGQIYTSTDSGVTWTEQAIGQQWASIASSADGRKLAAASSNGKIYMSIDFGVTWTPRGNYSSWRSITSSADGTKLAALDGVGACYISSDSGVTWTALAGFRILPSIIISSADGRKLAAAVEWGNIYTATPIPASVITYTAPAGTGRASFTFQVQDSASTDNLDLSPNTITFDFDQTVPTVDRPLLFNPRKGQFEQNVTVTNNLMGVTMPGFRLIVSNLPNNIDLINKTHPFLPVIDSLADLVPGDSRTVTVSFKIKDKNFLAWQPTYQVLSLGSTERNLPTDFSGVCTGLVERSSNVYLSANPNVGARIDITTSKAGAVSGAIVEGATRFPFVAKLNLDPVAYIAPYIKIGVPKTNKALGIVFDNQNGVFTGSLTPTSALEAPGVEVHGLRKVWTTARRPGAYAGRHHYSIRNASTTEGPQGFGYGSYTITGTTGGFVRAGKLADGSTITGSGFVGANGQVFVYQPLYANRGSVIGFQQIQLGLSLAEGTLSGELDWFKPVPASAKSTDLVYRDGFGPLKLACTGGYYAAPAKGQIPLGMGEVVVSSPNGEISFLRGGLETEMAEFQTPLHINSKNTVTPQAPNLEKLRFTRFDVITGLFTGSFIRPAQSTVPARTVTFEGQISYDDAADRELGHGFFLMPQIPVAQQKINTSPRLSGSVQIVPAGNP